MNKYTITHGSIASVQYVTLPDGQKVIVTDAQDGSEKELPKLPMEAAMRFQHHKLNYKQEDYQP